MRDLDQWLASGQITVNNQSSGTAFLDSDWTTIQLPIKLTNLFLRLASLQDSTAIYGESILLASTAEELQYRITAYTGARVESTTAIGLRFLVIGN